MITTTLHVKISRLRLTGDSKEIIETYQPMATDFMVNLYVLSLCILGSDWLAIRKQRVNNLIINETYYDVMTNWARAP